MIFSLPLNEESYHESKKKNLENLLEKFCSNIDWVWVGAHSRRKVTFQINGQNRLGFFAEKSHKLIEIDKDDLAAKEISALIPDLKNFLKKQEQNFYTQVTVTLFDSGLNVVFSTTKTPNFSQNKKLTDFAKAQNFNISCRVKNEVTPIFLIRKNQIFYPDFKIDLDSDIFIQATRAGLESIIKIIRSSLTSFEKGRKRPKRSFSAAPEDFAEANSESESVSLKSPGATHHPLFQRGLIPPLKKEVATPQGVVGGFVEANSDSELVSLKSPGATRHPLFQRGLRVADIYAGFGAYSFAIHDLAKSIFACEGSEKMVDLINKNAAANNLGNKIKSETRDLFSNPLTKKELNKFDIAIINPPRNGATPQILEIAQSALKNLIYVSCNPESFARDAKILIDSGFKLATLTALDQFYSTRHLELIGVFEK